MTPRPDLNKLAKEVFEANKAKGFHDEERSNETLLMLVITELSEAVITELSEVGKADTKGKRAHLDSFNIYMRNVGVLDKDYMDIFSFHFDNYIKDTVEDKLSDAVIRLLYLAGLRGIEIDKDYEMLSASIGNTEFAEVIFNVVKIIMDLKYVKNENYGKHFKFIIFCIESICQNLSIDLWLHVELKLKYNATRPHKHGKKY